MHFHRLLFVLAVVSLALSMGSCKKEPIVYEEIELEVGTGEWQFEAVSRDSSMLSDAMLARGSQGGFHVWVSMRTFERINPKRVSMSLVAKTDTRVFSVSNQIEVDFVERNDGSFAFIGWPAQLVPPECADDKTLTVEVEINTKDGKHAKASMQVNVRFEAPAGWPMCAI